MGKDTKQYGATSNGDWARCLRGAGSVRDPKELSSWVIVVPRVDQMMRQGQALVQELQRQGREIGMPIARPSVAMVGPV
jgi:hypothetical protein